MRDKKTLLRVKRHNRIRMRISGTTERPRLVIRRSLKNFHAQIIDDTQNKILLSVSTLDKEIKAQCKSAGNIKASECLGQVLARRAIEKGIGSIVFDRAGYLYHGRVKAFAENLRKGGLQF